MSAITRIQGMQDLLPEDWRYWSYVIQTATETAQTFGFEQISVRLACEPIRAAAVADSNVLTTFKRFAFGEVRYNINAAQCQA